MIRHTILMMFFLTTLHVIFPSVTNAQKKQFESDAPDNLISSPNCEDWISWINKGLSEWEKDKETALIIIFRPNVKEKSRTTNLQRLKTMKEYISGIESRNRIRVNPVFAEGESTGDLPVVEFYVKGKLLFSLQVLTKKDLPIRFCEFAEGNKDSRIFRPRFC